MFDGLQAWAARWNDLIDLAGFVLTLVGFGVTIFGVWRAKGAVEQARRASLATFNALSRYDAIVDLSSATAIMEEIKRLQRHGAWSGLPDRYSELRRRLVTIRGSHAQLTEGQRQVLQESIETFADLERRVERALSTGGRRRIRRS